MSVQSDIFFRTIITRNLKKEFRTPFNIAWLLALNKRVGAIYDEFKAFRLSSVLAMKRNGQKIIFEDLLNKAFPEAGGAIFITTEQSNSDLVFMGLGNTSDTGVFLGMAQDQGVFMGLPSAYAYDFDFIVDTPEGIDLDIAHLRSLVAQNKLSGRRFVIRKGTEILASSWTLTPSPVN